MAALRQRTRAAEVHEAKVWEVLETAPAGVAILDGTGRILFLNHRAEEVLGYAPGELIGKPLEAFVPLGLREEYEAHLSRGTPTGKAGCWLEFTGRRKDGSEVPLEVNFGPIERSGGVSAACVFRDVTERKRAERQLGEANNRLRGIIEGTSDLIAAIDLEFRYIAFNRGFEEEFRKVFGMTVALGMSVAEALADRPEARARALAHWTRALGGETFTVVEKVGGETGNRNIYEITFHSILDDEGRLIGASHVVRDVTERVCAARALEENRALLQAVLDNSRAVIYAKDDQGRYILVNRWHETLFKLSRDWIIGRTDYELFTKDKAEELRANDRRVLESAAPLEFEEDVPLEDGMHTYISIKFPLFDAEGIPYALCGISTDITARKRSEEQLRLQNLRLQEAAHSERQAHQALEQTHEALRQAEKLSLLGRLIAGVAHEIKNPLACALSVVAVLPRDLACLCDLIRLYREGDDALAAHRPEVLDRVRDLAERIDLDYTLRNLEQMAVRAGDALKRIQQLCQDLQDFSRPDRVELADADLNAGVRATVNLITGRAKDQEVELEVDLATLPIVRCALGRINQVVLNLLANAIDACPRGGKVTLHTRTGSGVVEVHVYDTGHGIEPSIRDRIFDPYFTTKPVGQGTGLGLAISHEIVRAHGGRIEVDSTPGRGAHFTVSLPCGPLPNGHLAGPVTDQIADPLASGS